MSSHLVGMIYILDMLVPWLGGFFGGNRTMKLFFGVVSFLMIWFTIGLRWQTGSDWDIYFAHYTGRMVYDFEPGYAFLVWLFNAVGAHYTVFLLFISLVPFVLICAVLYRESEYYFASLAFFAVNYMLGFMGGNRQSIAVGILLVGVIFIVRRDLFRFLLCVGIASLFHYSSFAFLPAYWIASLRFSWKTRYAILALAVLFSFTVGPVAIDLAIGLARSTGFDIVASKLIIYKSYLFFEGFTWTSIAKKVILLVVFELFLLRGEEARSRDRLFIMLYFFSIVIDVVFGSMNAAFMRASLSYRIVEIVLVASVLRRFDGSRLKHVAYIFFLVYCARQLYAGLSVYYNLYVPYGSIFSR